MYQDGEVALNAISFYGYPERDPPVTGELSLQVMGMCQESNLETHKSQNQITEEANSSTLP